jgi:hypothetical protein
MKKGFADRVLIEKHGKWLWVMRSQPWHAAQWLAGIALPPHERFWLGVFFADYKSNNVVASRGTSKSFSHASLAAPLKAVLFRNVAILTLSASGFRGGKELFRDTERMFDGTLKSQEPTGHFLKASVKSSSGKTIAKDPSMWTINLKSTSRYSTVPTNNPDQLRGLRANVVVQDEFNFLPPEISTKIIEPMLNVGGDFRRAASGGDSNKQYKISTIDFTVREWYKELQNAEQMKRNEYAAAQARRQGDWYEYDRLMNEKSGQLRTSSFSYNRFDYTDLLIPEVFVTVDGNKRYRTNYPLEKGIERDDVLRYDERDQQSYWYTYPVDKRGLESPMLDGTVDPEIWLAEQRNCFISSSGNVFDFDLIQRVAERPLYTAKETPNTRRRKKDDEDDDITKEEFYAPLMFTCNDPCVLGVDYGEADDTAFVVIRLGELAEGDFDPFVERYDERTGRQILGNTPWNHICWAEAWNGRETSAAAEKIRELFERYNIVHTIDIGGIALDKRGGGQSVRSDLGNPKPPVLDDGSADPEWNWDEALKFFDPADTGEAGFAHYTAYNDPTKYWSGLRMLATQNQDNVEWTFGSRAMMQAKRLYIAHWTPPSIWAERKGLTNAGGEPDRQHPEFKKWEVGYTGIRRLKTQLQRIQMKVSETGVIRFVMPGDRTKEEGKKDLWAAMIYAISLARQHLTSLTKEPTQAPMVEGLVVEVSLSNDFNNTLAI